MKQTQTIKYSVQGHSHDHLHHLLEKFHLPLDDVKVDHHQHNQELSYCPLFRGMTQREHDEFLDRNVSEILTYEKGEIIVRQGDPIHSVLLLVQGSVRTEMITMEGNVLDIDILEAVIPLAPSFIYGTKNNYPVDVIAIETAVFLKISKEAWLDEMARNKQLLTNFLTMNADLTLFLTNKLQMISLKSLRKKLATFFLDKTTVKEDTFTLKRSRTQLAEYFGVQRQSLARSLKEMEEEGIIQLRGRVVSILDRNKLIRE
ncbi:MAG: Crp/Fnr family transcriptional regulator [Bacteroidia bacterium]|nr:Crp/Fnr family transcriptional regulator [Bacteroidia bacterium]